MNANRRWMKSAIAASAEPMPVMPWQRDARTKPQAVKLAPAKPAAKRAIAAR